MIEVNFNFKGFNTKIQCNLNDKIKTIINKFISKIGIKNNDIYFLYNGELLDNEQTFVQQANEFDKSRKKMNILVYENNINTVKENEILSKEIICPECNENILFDIKDYKINLFECKNNHIKKNLLLNEFENSQNINISKIIFNNFKNYNKSNTYNNEFYICYSCGINLCPICKSKHDRNHNIINYDEKNYICKKHYDTFISYCKECKENMCFLCKNEHYNHDIIYFENIIVESLSYLYERKFF